MIELDCGLSVWTEYNIQPNLNYFKTYDLGILLHGHMKFLSDRGIKLAK